MMDVKKLRNNPFQHYVGITVLQLGGGKSVLQLELEKHHFNLYGIPHGGVHATLLDIAMGLCGTWAESPDERRVAITLSLNTNFSATAQAGSRVRAVATCRSGGHKVFMASCDLLDQDDKLLGFGDGVFKKGAYRKDLP